MLKLEPKNKQALIDCAMGRIQADMCLTNAKLVNVLTGEVYPADIYIYDKFIAHVESENVGQNIDAKKIVDCDGQYLIPGFIDSHIHIESSMLTPRNFARGVVNHGTTTVVTDPHEIANVFGKDAVVYMHDSSDDLPMRQLIDIPSCVPAVPSVENAGAEFFAKDIYELAKLERVVGLAEVMDYLGVVNNDPRMVEILKAAKECGLYLQGHAPMLSGRILSAYSIGGARTCHESRTEKEFLDKLRIGMHVDVRESSMAKNAREGVLGTQRIKFYDQFSVCTDDKESDDILNEGHLNIVVRKLIDSGLDPLTAIKGATINNARQIKMENLGAIAPGYIADILVVKSLYEVAPSQVYFEGKLVSENGKLVEPIKEKKFEIEEINSINLKSPSLDKFIYNAPIKDGMVKVNVIGYHDLRFSLSKCAVEEIPVKDGVLDLSFDPNLKFVTIFNRYGKETIGYGVLRNFGTNQGAIASSVSHDSHNVTVVYDTPENGKAAVDALIDIKGGMAVANHGKVIGTLPLQVGGLMSINTAEVVAEQSQVLKDVMREIGLTVIANPLLRIVTCALPVIPDTKMSDLGIIDVATQAILPLYPDYTK